MNIARARTHTHTHTHITLTHTQLHTHTHTLIYGWSNSLCYLTAKYTNHTHMLNDIIWYNWNTVVECWYNSLIIVIHTCLCVMILHNINVQTTECVYQCGESDSRLNSCYVNKCPWYHWGSHPYKIHWVTADRRSIFQPAHYLLHILLLLF